jgi:hypothetical protein
MHHSNSAESIIELSLRGLERMYDPARQTLFSVTFESGQRETVEHLGVRYTVMSSLGVHDAIAAGRATTLDPKLLLQSGLARHPAESIDHLGMALWAESSIQAGIAEDLVARLLKALDGDLDRAIGRVLAWALTGLALHAAEDDDPKVKAACERLWRFARDRCWNATGQLFNHRATGRFFERTQSLFSTQIYWVYALSTFGRIFKNEAAIDMARQCAHRLIGLCDPRGGWPWRYDAPNGQVTERYPVYAVHQDAMAPMALRALTAACGEDFERTIEHSLSWLWHSELGSVVDHEEQVIYRAVRRRYPLNRAAFRLGWGLAYFGRQSPLVDRPVGLRMNRTCRPYHLGWVLHAWLHPWADLAAR